MKIYKKYFYTKKKFKIDSTSIYKTILNNSCGGKGNWQDPGPNKEIFSSPFLYKIIKILSIFSLLLISFFFKEDLLLLFFSAPPCVIHPESMLIFFKGDLLSFNLAPLDFFYLLRPCSTGSYSATGLSSTYCYDS